MTNLKVICRFSIPKCYRLCLVNIHFPTRSWYYYYVKEVLYCCNKII